MYDDLALTPFSHYVRLYTLHQVERAPQILLLRIRIETLRYSFAPLSSMPLDAAYADDPRAGAELVRQAVLPRLSTLLDLSDPFSALSLGAEQDALWPRYAAERRLPPEPVRPPIIHTPTPPRRLPARSKTAERLARAQQALELFQTAVDTAATLAAVWQNWQIGRARRELLETQRVLLQDTIRAQLAGQDQALAYGQDREFVRGYLADHAGDSAYPIVFENPPGEQD